MTARAVTHYVERYPLAQQGYVFDQVLVSRGDRVVALERLPGRPSPLPEESVRAPAPRLAFLPERARLALDNRVLWRAHARSPRRQLEALGSTRVIHAHFGMAGARLAARGHLPEPLVTTFYGVDASACLQDARWRARYDPLWTHGTLHLVLADEVRHRLVAAGCPVERIRVWNIGIDLSRYAKMERRWPTNAPLGILCAARFVPKKGHDVLIEAVARVASRRPVRLTLLGYGPLLDDVRRHAGRLGLGEVTTLIDTSQMEDFDGTFASALGSHDVFALPSRTATDGDDEGGPALTVVCAQSSGMPAVVTAFPGAERSVTHGETGLIAEGTPESLADQILALDADPARAVSLGAAGAAVARDQFELQRQLEILADHYEEAVALAGEPRGLRRKT